MTKQDLFKQLESIKENSQSFICEGCCEEWRKDIKAIDIVLKLIKDIEDLKKYISNEMEVLERYQNENYSIMKTLKRTTNRYRKFRDLFYIGDGMIYSYKNILSRLLMIENKEVLDNEIHNNSFY